MKVCTRCNQPKDSEKDFHLLSRKTGTRHTICKECRKTIQKAYYEANKKRLNAATVTRRPWITKLCRELGITRSAYDQLIASRNGTCDLGHPAENLTLCLDHCHQTLVVRGVLCQNCNVAIGMMADDPDRLEAAAQYLRASWSFSSDGRAAG